MLRGQGSHPQVLVPPLRQLEVRLFAALVARLWRSAAADAAASEPGVAFNEGSGSKPSPPASPATPRPSPRSRPLPSAEEAAVRRWLDGLQARARAGSLLGFRDQNQQDVVSDFSFMNLLSAGETAAWCQEGGCGRRWLDACVGGGKACRAAVLSFRLFVLQWFPTGFQAPVPTAGRQPHAAGRECARAQRPRAAAAPARALRAAAPPGRGALRRAARRCAPGPHHSSSQTCQVWKRRRLKAPVAWALFC